MGEIAEAMLNGDMTPDGEWVGGGRGYPRPYGDEGRVRRARSLPPKAAYVKSQGQTRNHECHWPNCDKQVPPAMWGCSPHWFKLPKPIRDAIWRAFRPGQEKDGKPSAAYIEAAQRAQDWIEKFGAPKAVG